MNTSETPNQHNAYEKVILFLDTDDPMHDSKIIIPIGAMAGIGAALGAYTGVKELLFPQNDTYENIQEQVRNVQQRADSLILAADIMTKEGRLDAAEDARELAVRYTALTEQKEGELPSNYNPHVEGIFSGAGAILAAVLVFRGITGYVTRKASDIRSRA